MPSGERIGPYEIRRLLGRGAMGEVYQVADTKMFGRLAALKVLSRRPAASETAQSRFQREIEVVARLQHPNIITVYDWGEWDGRPYFVMEYVDGVDLACSIREHGSRTLDERLEIARQICDGLDFAHEHGVVHRDIKPANIMVARRGGRDVPKLVDFGVVHVTRSELTRSESQPGTFAYMAPEQLRNEEVTARSDLFSLGIVLYELFTGRHPFEDASDILVSGHILHDEARPLRDLAPDLPAGLDRLVLRALQKDPASRPASAREMSDAFAAILREHWRTSRPVPPGAAGDPGGREPPDGAEAGAGREGDGSAVADALALADASLRRGRLEEARSHLVGVLRSVPGERRAVALLDRLLTIEERGIPYDRYAEALDAARAALAEGRLDDALRSCNAARDLWPGDDEVAALRQALEEAVAASAGKPTPCETESPRRDPDQPARRPERRRRLGWVPVAGGTAALLLLAVVVLVLALPSLREGPEAPVPRRPEIPDRTGASATPPAPQREAAAAAAEEAEEPGVHGSERVEPVAPEESAPPSRALPTLRDAPATTPPPGPPVSQDAEPALPVPDPAFVARAGAVTALEQWLRAYQSLDADAVRRLDPSTPDPAALQAVFDRLESQTVELLEPEMSIASDHRSARVRGILRFLLNPRANPTGQLREVRARFEMAADDRGGWRILESELTPLPAETAVRRVLDEWERGHEALDASVVRRVQPAIESPAALQDEMSALAWQRIELRDERIYVERDGRSATVNCSIEWESRERGGGEPRRRTLLGTFRLEQGPGGWVITAVELF